MVWSSYGRQYMNKKLEEENEKLRESLEKTNQELQKSKYYQVTPKQWLGGGIGILCYVILKAIGGYGWHGGDVIGLILLGFLPGAALAGSVFNND